MEEDVKSDPKIGCKREGLVEVRFHQPKLSLVARVRLLLLSAATAAPALVPPRAPSANAGAVASRARTLPTAGRAPLLKTRTRAAPRRRATQQRARARARWRATRRARLSEPLGDGGRRRRGAGAGAGPRGANGRAKCPSGRLKMAGQGAALVVARSRPFCSAGALCSSSAGGQGCVRLQACTDDERALSVRRLRNKTCTQIYRCGLGIGGGNATLAAGIERLGARARATTRPGLEPRFERRLLRLGLRLEVRVEIGLRSRLPHA